MELEPIIEALRTRVPYFSNRIAGAAQFKQLQENAQLQVPFAFVIPADDTPGEQLSSNALRQNITDSFAVIVVLSNTADEKGQGSAKSVHQVRSLLWSALLGWSPTEDYDGIIYEGGQLLQLDRARMWYQFEFSAVTQIDDSYGWQGPALDALPHYDGGTINVDVIAPMADPNVSYPGPDGRIEAGAVYPKTGNLPS
jgi:hypothetical protein